jgi:hypothetical protein
MDAEKFLERVIIALTVVSVAAYVHYHLKALAEEDVVNMSLAESAGFRVSDYLPKAQVYFKGRDVTECKLSTGGSVWRCSDRDWNYVGASSQKMGGRARRCVWAHPLTNKTLVIRFDNVDVGSRIKGFYGIVDGVSTENPGTVNISVLADETRIFEGATVRSGLKEFDVASGSAKNIEFRIFTEKDVRRHFCFDAWSA